MIKVEPKTIVVFADIACPWSHVAVHRLRRTRARLGLEDSVRFDMRAFPLEVFNERPTPKRILDAEVPVAGRLAPDAGWQMWQRCDHDYPVTTLLALEAVQAAKDQGLQASAALDAALRRALFAESRNISLRHEVLAVAEKCGAVDCDALAKSLDNGTARALIFEQAEVARHHVKGSPHLFLPDGTDAHNPGIRMRWHGPSGRGFPVVESDTAEVYDDLLHRAAR